MSRLGKTIISLVSAGIVAVCGILLYVFWPAITGTINKNKYYTSEDIQSSYDKGFDDGNKSETELTAEIIYYKSLIDEYESEVRSLNKEISDLITLRNQSDSTLQTLTSVKAELESQVDDLSNLNNENNVTIANLNIQINDLKNQVSSLSVNNHEKIMIYGDYDVDGVTSVAALWRYLTFKGADVCCYIPERVNEGYGLNVQAIEKFAAEGIKLIITSPNINNYQN